MFRMTIPLLAAVLGGSIAGAADLPSRKAPPSLLTPAPVFSWTGFYFGAQAGYISERFTQYSFGGFGTSGRRDGVIGGAHAGYNMQFGSVVAGVEGDFDGTSLRATRITASPFGGFNVASIRQDFRGSLRGRLGYAFDRLLIYATGGLAVANFRSTIGGPLLSETDSNPQAGYTVGGGLEYAVLPNLSLRAEYRYSDFSRINQSSLVAFPGANFQTAVRDHAVRGGVSYHFNTFGGTPVVARY